MPKVLIKDLFVEIRHSLGRFLSIMAIVALGVAFFAGIKASAPDMKYSADQYFDEYNLQDIQVYSTVGLDDEDLKAIAAIQGVKNVQPVFSMDVLTYVDSSELVYKIFNLPDTQNINTIRLVDGRMPQNKNECLIEAASVSNSLYANFDIGDTITLQSGDDTNLDDVLSQTTYTIVGTCYTPYYLSYEKGTSSIGSGKVTGFIYIPDEDIIADYYTEIDVTVNGASELNAYSDEYFDLVDPIVDKIEDVADKQISIFKTKQEQKIADAQKELDDSVADAKQEIEDGQKQIEDGQKEISENESKLADAKEQLNAGWNEYNENKATLNSNYNLVTSSIAQIQEQSARLPELNDNLAKVQSGLEQCESTKQELLANQTKLTDAISQLKSAQEGLAQINDALENPTLPEETKKELEAKKAEIQAQLESSPDLEVLQSQLEQVKQGLAQVQETQSDLETGLGQINDSIEMLQTAKTSLAQIEAMLETPDLGEEEIASLTAQKQALEQTIANAPSLKELQGQKEQAQAALAQIQANKQELEASQTQLESAIAQIQQAKEGLAQIDEALEHPSLPEETKKELEAKKAEIEAQLENSPSIEELQQQLEQVKAGLVQVEATKKELNENLQALQNGISQINDAAAMLPELNSSLSQIQSGQSQLADAYNTLVSSQQEYDDGLKQIEDAKQEIIDAQKEVEDGQKELDEKSADGQKEIDDAKKELDDLDPKWVVLDRNSHYSYRDYGATADRMDGIASVFPVFFFLVAALVCMTTMTRMVDEQRTEIGTLKALGYSKLQIAMKYLAYAFLASIAGCVIGCAVGMFVFPYIIFYAWNTMYNIETIRYQFQPGLILMASAAVTGVVLLATIYSIYRELVEVPSQLMRPKASKAGKKILLERIPWIWNKVSFLKKVTIRNIFRYKKRFFMTVIGIAGCSALLVAGFGINDSISDIVNLQYVQIYHYDASLSANSDDAASIAQSLKSMNGIEAFYQQDTLSVSLDIEDKDVSGTVHIVTDPQQFQEFTTLKSISNKKEEYSVEGEGVYINEKMAQKMDLSIGDSFEMEYGDDQKITTTVAGIYENYVGHHIYVSQETFDSWHVDPDDLALTFLLRTSDTSESFEHQLGIDLMNLDGAKSVTFYSSLQENFLNMIGSIKMVVVVLVISAAALAFVVLYNLSNVNISERMREIATIKVLGFTEKEVNAYVNRESIVLTIVGSIAGLFVGIYLHQLIMALAELDDIMFGRTISAQSYILSFVLTIVFGILVNWVMKFKLRKIEMVESLKAVE
jgi:putative ABC transport system permease protein